VFEPRNSSSSVFTPELGASSTASELLIARGLQQQHNGDPAAFIEKLRVGLALNRNMRQRTTQLSLQVATTVERQSVSGVERWLERLNGRPDLLRRALKTLVDHAEAPPTDWAEIHKAEYAVALDAFSDPRNLANNRNRNTLSLGVVDNPDLLEFSLQVPWEKARLRRLLDAFASGPEQERLAEQLAPPLVSNRASRYSRVRFFHAYYPSPRDRCALRAAILQVALRLYHAESGRTAEKLAELVPKYLSAVPKDPFDGQLFRYRISRGDVLDWPPDFDAVLRGEAQSPQTRSVRKVPAGQGILWCVGDDGRDDGGRIQAGSYGESARGEDVIFLVPQPPA
jgi:hypothetical protein